MGRFARTDHFGAANCGTAVTPPLCKANLQIGRNPEVLQIGNTTRLFVSIGYRVNF